MWSVTKADVQQTLANVCTRVMHDHSITTESRARRAKALLLLGEEYCKCAVPVGSGIEDFLEKMGVQTGMFGEPAQPNPNPSASPPPSPEGRGGVFEGAHDRFNTEAKVLAALVEVESLGIKEMRSRIEQLKGNANGCIEKADVKKRLKYLLCQHLSVEALRKHVAQQLGSEGIIDTRDAEREMLVDIIMNL